MFILISPVSEFYPSVCLFAKENRYSSTCYMSLYQLPKQIFNLKKILSESYIIGDSFYN